MKKVRVAKITQPSSIIIFRHAEKPVSKVASGLSVAGQARAKQLASFIPHEFGIPDFIFATAMGKISNRELETVTPLAQACGININSKFAEKDYPKLAQLLVSNPKYVGKRIVICWHHGTIPELAMAITNLPTFDPNPWPKKIFNLVVELLPDSNTQWQVKKVYEPF